MNLFRILLFLVAAYIVWRLYRALRAKSEGGSPMPRTPGDDYEVMVRCARCGIHAPASSLSKSGLCGRCSE
jgi:threonine/homoserine/homoserine lactone efflux protein